MAGRRQPDVRRAHRLRPGDCLSGARPCAHEARHGLRWQACESGSQRTFISGTSSCRCPHHPLPPPCFQLSHPKPCSSTASDTGQRFTGGKDAAATDPEGCSGEVGDEVVTRHGGTAQQMGRVRLLLLTFASALSFGPLSSVYSATTRRRRDVPFRLPERGRRMSRSPRSRKHPARLRSKHPHAPSEPWRVNSILGTKTAKESS